MTTISSLKTIPVFDLNDFARDKEKFADALGQAFHTYGFVRLKNHGIPETTLKAAEDVSRRFFSMHDDVKENYAFAEHDFQVGFNKNREKANGQTDADRKEYFMVCRDHDQDKGVSENTPRTPEINEIPEFRSATYDLYYAFNDLIQRVLEPLAIHIGEDEGYFRDISQQSEDMMRMIHYPSGGNASPHTDMSLLTLLRAEEAGLYVTARNGEELPVVAEPGELILNGGKALAALTNNYFKPSVHRVEVKADKPRHTIVYFAHLNCDVMLDVVDGLKDYDGGLQDEEWFGRLSQFPLVYEQYKRERLAKNFVLSEQDKKAA